MDNTGIFYVLSFGILYLVISWGVISFGNNGTYIYGIPLATIGWMMLAVPFVFICFFGALWLAEVLGGG